MISIVFCYCYFSCYHYKSCNSRVISLYVFLLLFCSKLIIVSLFLMLKSVTITKVQKASKSRNLAQLIMNGNNAVSFLKGATQMIENKNGLSKGI